MVGVGILTVVAPTLVNHPSARLQPGTIQEASL